MTAYIFKIISLLGGLALFLFGMDIMGKALERQAGGKLQTILAKMSSKVWKGFLLGLAVTAVIQSSSASVGILQGLCVTGTVTYGAAIPIILGQNIGTCVTAMMGSIGANRNARRTAIVHLLFNVVGATIFVIVFYGLGMFIDWTFLSEPLRAWNISVIHTGFNLAATAVLLPLNGLLVKLAYVVIPREETPQEQVVDALVREVKSRHVRRLRDGLCTVEYGFVLEDLLTACERTADHCSNVAVEMLQVSEGKLEAHEYLNALKAGELHESAAFAEQFAQYKAQYAFPEE